MCKKLIVFGLSLCLISSAGAATVNWDFENGNDHGFTLRSLVPPIPGEDDPDKAGDEALTGGLPEAGLAWHIGSPGEFEGLFPAVAEGDNRDADGRLQYGANNQFNPSVGDDGLLDFTNGRGQSSYLNTYALSQWGDGLHTAENDQIATSPIVVLDANAVLTVWSVGAAIASWAGTTTAPELDPDPNEGYVSGSAGIAVLSADDGSLLANLFPEAWGINDGNMPDEFSLDLSDFAGQEVIIEVVDAAAGGYGWIAVDEIQITNATLVLPEMVAHWPMDEGAGTVAADVVGGNDGTLVGGVSWLAEGGVSFDNIDGSHIEVPHADVLDFGDVDFSISMLIRYPTELVGIGAADRWIIKGTHGDPGTGNRYEVFHTSGSTVRFTIDNDTVGKTKLEVDDTAIVTGEWVHVVAVRDAANDLISLYADGVLLGSTEDVSGDISSGEDMWIGESTDETDTAMSGDMADIRIYGAALTEDEIASIYPPVPPIAGLVVEDPDQLMGFEPQMLERLESLGYVVEIIRGDDVKNEVFTMADAEALDVMVVSEAISSSDMNKLVGADVPMMHGEGFGWHKMNLAEEGTQDWQDVIGPANVVNDTHPIVVNAGLNLGTMDFLMHESASTTTAEVSVLAPGAVNLVSMTIADAEYALVFAIDEGAELAKGAGPAVNRIVGFSLPGNQDGVLSDEGWALFDAAIAWLDAVD